jgi:threonine dehydratase
MAASSFDIPAYIVMPTISTSSKIAGTKAYTEHVIFSGSTGAEREAVLAKVMEEHNAILIPPYDHPDIMLGQGTSALELDEQYTEAQAKQGSDDPKTTGLNMVITPCGGGGLLSGTTIYFSDKPETYVFGAEPSYQGADDAKRGLEATPPTRITSVSTLTIADGLRTYVGENPWGVLTGSSEKKPKFLQGIRSVSEEEIKQAMKLLLERLKVFVEPSACVGLAALLYDQQFRQWIQEMQGDDTWDIGVTLSGGNTTIDAILGIFGTAEATAKEERHQGTLGQDGRKVAENIAG